MGYYFQEAVLAKRTRLSQDSLFDLDSNTIRLIN